MRDPARIDTMLAKLGERPSRSVRRWDERLRALVDGDGHIVATDHYLAATARTTPRRGEGE